MESDIQAACYAQLAYIFAWANWATSEIWSRPVCSFFQKRTLSTGGAYVKPDAKQYVASVQRESGRICGEKYPAMCEKFSATGCVRK